ncbi:type II toxin-antitoxin system PemK/MazF family toxin [Paralcaligenes ginsengisoli]
MAENAHFAPRILLIKEQFAKLHVISGATALGWSLRGLSPSQRPTEGDIKPWWVSEKKAPFIGGLCLCGFQVIDTIKKNNALKLYLKTGEVVICNFDTGFMVPEMVKIRPVVVISKSATHWRGLCTIVPLSTTSPEKVEGWHIQIANPLAKVLPLSHEFARAERVWAKCDMLYTVSFDRLSRPHRRSGGHRCYDGVRMAKDDLDAVFRGVRAYLPAER